MTAKIKKPGKKMGTRLKPKPVDPKVRAAKRMLQAERATATYASDRPEDFASARYVALVARIEKLKAGKWPTDRGGYGGTGE